MKTRREIPDDDGSHGNADEHRPRHDGQERREDGTGQLPRLTLGFLLVILGKDGDEGCGHGAFGEQLTQQTGNPERDIKGIGRRRRTEEAGHDHVPDKSENPAGEGTDADDAGRMHHRALIA